MAVNIISQQELFDRMRDGCGTASRRPPFTLILGSGFSFPIIPTTSQIVREDLPWWKWCQSSVSGGPTRRDFFERQEEAFSAKIKGEAQAFWKKVFAAELVWSSGKPSFSLDADGLPAQATIGDAYRFVLSPKCGPGLSSPEQVRRYFADLVQRIDRRLNPAHLYLSAVIAELPRLFGTIFTTNFDPLLQRALQLVNRSYFVSDRPDTMQHPDDDDVNDAIHLIYAHGSIYRYLLLNSPEQIEEYANRNQPLLQEYFRQHAVLIVGYSGWDDAITRALLNVEQFAHNLYWCDRGASPEKSNLTNAARQVLAKHANAFFVPIAGADQMMVNMHQHLTGHALTKLFRSPIAAVQDQLRRCDLSGVLVSATDDYTNASPASAWDENGTGITRGTGLADHLDLGNEVLTILRRLDDAQLRFTGAGQADEHGLLAAKTREQFSIATDLYYGTNPSLAIPLLDFVIGNAHILDAGEQALALFRRAVIYRERGGNDGCDQAIADNSAVINVADAPALVRIKAQVNRSCTYLQRGQVGDSNSAIADANAVISMSDVPADQLALARINRGVAYGRRADPGDLEREIADYVAVINLPEVPAEYRAMAYLNRGVCIERSTANRAGVCSVGDYSSVIDMPGIPIELRAKARVQRAFAYRLRARVGDVDLAIADSTDVIETPNVSTEQVAWARHNRALAYRDRRIPGDLERMSSDFSVLIAMPGTPAGKRIEALLLRGWYYRTRNQPGDLDLSIADFSSVIGALNVDADRCQNARLNRAVSYTMRKRPGDTDCAIADYKAVLIMTDVTDALRANVQSKLSALLSN